MTGPFRSLSDPSRVDAAALRRLVNSIDVPEPFDLETFVERVGNSTGHTIRLHPQRRIPRELCGVLIATEGTNHIFFEAATTPFHQMHIVLHELGHLLLGHRTRDDDSSPAAVIDDLAAASADEDRPLFSGLNHGKAGVRSAVEIMLGRSAFDHPDEKEAELAADVLASALTLRRRRRRASKGSSFDTAFDLG